MADPGGGEAAVYSALYSLQHGVDTILTGAKPLLQDPDVKESDLVCLRGALWLYSKYVDQLDLTKRKEIDGIVEKYQSSSRVQEVYKKLQQTEKEWDALVREMDTRLYSQKEPVDRLVVGDSGPLKTALIDARTGLTTRLEDHLDGQSSLLVMLVRHLF